jgi:hypothetical protein
MTRKEGENNGGQNILFFPGHRMLVLLSLLLSIWCSVHHYFPLLSWSSYVSVAHSFVVYMVFCPPLFSSSFLVIVFWCCPVFCCLYSVLSTIISSFFPGHRETLYRKQKTEQQQNKMTRKEKENNGGQNTI